VLHRQAGVLATAVQVFQNSDNYKNAASKPAAIDLDKATSVSDAVRFINAVTGSASSASVSRTLLLYAVPLAVAKKLLGQAKKSDHYKILKENIIDRKDEAGNCIFTRSDLLHLDSAIINAMNLQFTAAKPAVQAAVEPAQAAPADDSADNDKAQPVSADAFSTPDKAEPRSKRQKN
jgi:hypothetical protein